MNIKQGDRISGVPSRRCVAADLVKGERVAVFGLTAGQSAFF